MKQRISNRIMVVALLFLATAIPAHADPLGGLMPVVIVFALVLIVLAEVTIAFVEAQAYHHIAKLTWPTAFRASLLANVTSLLLGTPALLAAGQEVRTALGTDARPLLVVIGLLLCLLIELPIIIAIAIQRHEVVMMNDGTTGGMRTAIIPHLMTSPSARRLLSTAIGVNAITYLALAVFTTVH